MKIRNGWVGNSSSSSFIILIGQPETKEDFESWFGDCGSLSEEQIKQSQVSTRLSKTIEKLYNENMISLDDASEVIFNISNVLRNISNVYIHSDGKLNIEHDVFYKEYTKEKVIDLLWNAWSNRGIARFENEYLKEDNIRVFNKIENWKDQLEDKNSYLYQQIEEDVRRGLEENLDNQVNGYSNRVDDFRKMYYRDLIDTYDLREKESFKALVDDLTEQKINYIKEYILDNDDELDCYVITFCSDDGESTDFDYVGRQGEIFRDTVFCIRDENS